jgi:hypothetical protein
MDIVTHANTLPWLIGPQDFMSLISYALDGLALSLLLGLLYAGLHRLISPRTGRTDDRQPQSVSPFDAELISAAHSIDMKRQRKRPSETRPMASRLEERITHET